MTKKQRIMVYAYIKSDEDKDQGQNHENEQYTFALITFSQTFVLILFSPQIILYGKYASVA